MDFAAIALLLALAVSCVALGGVQLGAGIVGLLGGSRVAGVVESTRRAGWELSQFSLLGCCGLLYFSFPRLFFVLAGPLIVPFLALLICALCSGLALVLSRYRMTSVVFFSISAFGVPFCLGLLLGAMVLGRLDLFALGTYGYYFRPWLNLFCITLGLFLVSLFWFLGANYFSPESENLKKNAVALSGLVLSFAALVFVSGEFYDLGLFQALFSSLLAWVALFSLGVEWVLFSVWVHQPSRRRHVGWIGVAVVVSFAALWLGLFYPDVARFYSGETIQLDHAVQSSWAGLVLGGVSLLVSIGGPLVSVSLSD